MTTHTLKQKTARTIKWNSIDRFSTQILYAVTGVVLANVLPKEDFGLVGAILVFQAFATIFVDSGFGAALLQKKHPTQADYSTVFWFNLIVSLFLYGVLYACAPLLADLFQKDERLVPLSRVMFLGFVINGAGIVQTNRLMKAMDVRRIALSNVVGLTLSGVLGIYLALAGFGAWALVWQTLLLASVKTGWLWIGGKWLPSVLFSWQSLKGICRVGAGVFATSFLNTLFLNIYSFVIGVWYSLTALGVYTQAEKWSKMGSASISQILTASFVPLLARFQDDGGRFKAMLVRINRFTAFMLFPFMGGLIVTAPAIFHTLFGQKWDAAIVLFQLLVARGVFAVLCSLAGNYLLALGYARTMVAVEVVKDVLTMGAIGATVWMHSIDALVWGQLAAGMLTWVAVVFLTARSTGYGAATFTRGMGRYLAVSLCAMACAWPLAWIVTSAPVCLLLQALAGGAVYMAILLAMHDPVLADAVRYIKRKKNN